MNITNTSKKSFTPAKTSTRCATGSSAMTTCKNMAQRLAGWSSATMPVVKPNVWNGTHMIRPMMANGYGLLTNARCPLTINS